MAAPIMSYLSGLCAGPSWRVDGRTETRLGAGSPCGGSTGSRSGRAGGSLIGGLSGPGGCGWGGSPGRGGAGGLGMFLSSHHVGVTEPAVAQGRRLSSSLHSFSGSARRFPLALVPTRSWGFLPVTWLIACVLRRSAADHLAFHAPQTNSAVATASSASRDRVPHRSARARRSGAAGIRH
jgi:hypothetical protein